MASSLSGMHHVTFPVSDLTASTAWFEMALGAARLVRFDHHDENGTLFAVIVDVPGLGTVLELRLDPILAERFAGSTPVTFGVADDDALQRWVAHLDACGIEHSPITPRRIGASADFCSPDGLILRFYTNPLGGIDAVEFVE